MRTTVDLPEDLLMEVMKILRSESKKETIIKALTNIKNLNERQKILKYKGKVYVDLDIDKLRSRNDGFRVSTNILFEKM
ncbi:MAG: type II toxin-antitoxin system VapB family antitoxin [Saprospiraceae bacterium]|nr:type II toxin-antitoxin system VapB family antitoxin [Saprospiraceae bacterium]MBK9564336.1 type II toxin-antitoxin system VapB family antitoxin [Saprospiraceae bacterium]